jgi:hypothetical protein
MASAALKSVAKEVAMTSPNELQEAHKALDNIHEAKGVVMTQADIARDTEVASGNKSSLLVLAEAFKVEIEAAEHQHAASLKEVSDALDKAESRLDARLNAAMDKFRMAGDLARESLSEIDSAMKELHVSIEDNKAHLMRLRDIRLRRPTSR